jgi:cytochrome c-type biogenesis protein CcmH
MKAAAPLFALLAALVLSTPVTAKDAAPMAQDQVTEQRMIAISQDLRCLVCQNESLAGSHADLAEDLRREIRGLIRAGKSDQEITDYLVNRYGDFVRYKPPLKSTTWLLWFGPFLLLAIGFGALIAFLRQRNRGFGSQADEDRPLTAEEQRRADALLRNNDGQAP